MSGGVRALDVIARKRDGGEIPGDQLREFVLAYAREELPDYQMAAFLMAGYLRGFSRFEAEALTEAMVASGDRLDLGRLSGPTVDKHSTGGVADGTTLVVGPLAAALGMQVMKLSGRGLGNTGGAHSHGSPLLRKKRYLPPRFSALRSMKSCVRAPCIPWTAP